MTTRLQSQDILTAIDSLSLSTLVPLANAYLDTLFPTTGYTIVTLSPNSNSIYSTYTGGARGGLAKFVLAIHKDPVRASKVRIIRFGQDFECIVISYYVHRTHNATQMAKVVKAALSGVAAVMCSADAMGDDNYVATRVSCILQEARASAQIQGFSH
jgi:hypothetical protein